MDSRLQDPLFLQLPERERQEWAALPVTRLFLSHILQRRDQASDTALNLALNSDAKAAGWAGAHAALSDIYMDCTAERSKAEETTTDTTYVDPRKRKGS